MSKESEEGIEKLLRKLEQEAKEKARTKAPQDLLEVSVPKPPEDKIQNLPKWIVFHHSGCYKEQFLDNAGAYLDTDGGIIDLNNSDRGLVEKFQSLLKQMNLNSCINNYLAAENNIKEIFKIIPNWYSGYRHLGWIYEQIGKYKEAEEAYFKAADSSRLTEDECGCGNPPHMVARTSLAGLYQRQGRYWEADQQFRAALQIATINKNVLLNSIAENNKYLPNKKWSERVGDICRYVLKSLRGL